MSHDDEGMTALQDDVQKLLQAAGLPTAIIDRIIGLIAEGEWNVTQSSSEASQ